MTVTHAFATDRATTLSLAVDSDGAADSFDWSEANIVRIDNPPHEAAFDTDRFYKIPLTAARPVDQTYHTADGEVVMRKPPAELEQAAWSLDNAPITLGHPRSRIVDAVDKVHGFTRDPTWDTDEQSLDAFAYVPVTDTAAKSFIEDNNGVSIGFWYESDTSADEVDAYQRNLLVDHVAIVEEGRCSREDGCGLAADSASAIRGFHADTEVGECSDGACSCGLHTATTDASMDELDEVYSEWRDAVNMTASELRRWSTNPCSRQASQDPEAVIERNLRLLERNKDEWTTGDIEDAKRTVSFISRMADEENRPDSPADGANGCPSDWAISLLNWAYNPFDSLPDTPDEMDSVSEITTDRMSEDRHWTDHAKVSLEHQVGSRLVDIDMATAPAPFYVVLHDEGSEITRQNVDVGEQLGRDGPYDAFNDVGSTLITLDQPISEARRVYAVIYYADESGDLAAPLESQQGLVFDSAVVMPTRSKTRSIFDTAGTVDVASITSDVLTGDGSYETSTSLSADDASRTVAGVTFTGLRTGKLDESEIPNDDYESHYLYPADTKSDSSYPVVDGDGYLRRGNVEAAHKLGARGDVDDDEHDNKVKRLNEVFADASNHTAPIDSNVFDTDSHTQTMSDGSSDGAAPAIDVGDLTVDAIAAENDAVSELKEKRDELQSQLNDAKDECDEYETQLDAAKDEIDSLKEELESYRADEKQELVDEITALTDTWDEEELLDLEMDKLASRKELAEDLAADVSGTDVETDEAGGDDDSEFGEYERGEVYDLSETA